MRGDTFLAYLHPNDVSSSFHQALLDVIGWDIAHDARIAGWATAKCAPGGLPEGRNDVTSQFLDSDAEWLWMIDADMGFERMALDMLHHVADPTERPIVGGLCFAQREAFSDGMHGFHCVPRCTIFEMVEHEDGFSRVTGRSHYPANTLVRCAATGAAFLLIHRSVIERIAEEYGPEWWTRVRGDDQSLLGEDISFFVRCMALEIPCHVHTGVRTSHMKTVWLSEQDFWASYIPVPATERVDVVVPVLHRPDNVAPFMQTLTASTGLATAWFVCEPDDRGEQDEVLRHGGQVLECAGSFAQKANHAFERTEAPWVLLTGDDVRFRPAWLDHALEVAARYDADVVGTNDLSNPRVMRGEHATHPLIRRSYVDELGASWDGPGVLCHEGYRHWYVDDEIVTAARQRGVFHPALGAQVEHMHPIFGKGEHDDVYQLGQDHAKRDAALWKRRLREHAA